LVEGALFCHRCGKPQRDDLIERERLEREESQRPAAIPEISVAQVPSPEVLAAFNNRRAARASLLAAFLGFILMSMLVALLGGASVALALILAGFLTVFLYKRGTPAGEQPLSARLGARLGWMTGVFAFLFAFVQFTLNVAFSDVNIREMFRRQLEQQAASNPDLQNALQMLNSTPGVTAVVGTSIIVLFIIFTVLTTLGGALGAQFSAHPAGVKPDQKNNLS